MDFNPSSNCWVSQLEKSKFAVLVLGFEKLGLELDNCGRTTKNAYCCIHSLCLQCPWGDTYQQFFIINLAHQEFLLGAYKQRHDRKLVLGRKVPEEKQTSSLVSCSSLKSTRKKNPHQRSARSRIWPATRRWQHSFPRGTKWQRMRAGRKVVPAKLEADSPRCHTAAQLQRWSLIWRTSTRRRPRYRSGTLSGRTRCRSSDTAWFRPRACELWCVEIKVN